MTVQTPAKTSDFSAIAEHYDATREIPRAILDACYERLIGAGLLPVGGTILDAGCGTGQISLPLAEQGFRVRGFDISRAMAAIAQAKCLAEWDARYIAADIRSLPVPNDTFDAIVVSKVFQHVQDWQRACVELLRVLRSGGALIELRDRGVFGNALRRHFAARADALGYIRRYVGLSPQDRTPLAEFLRQHGCMRMSVDDTDLTWTRVIRLGDALDQLRLRLFAEFWYLPDDVYDHILAETAVWLDQHPDGPAQLEVMTPYLSLEVFRKGVN
jgi:ubiquinone/menaquinone biosynthesis C-methylase UbiE